MPFWPNNTPLRQKGYTCTCTVYIHVHENIEELQLPRLRTFSNMYMYCMYKCSIRCTRMYKYMHITLHYACAGVYTHVHIHACIHVRKKTSKCTSSSLSESSNCCIFSAHAASKSAADCDCSSSAVTTHPMFISRVNVPLYSSSLERSSSSTPKSSTMVLTYFTSW